MLRQIRVKKNFKQIVDIPLVTGDTNAYELLWSIGEEAKGAVLQVIAKRNDMSIVCDTCNIGMDGVARYILKNNMYAISGSMKLMLSVISGESILTEKVLCFNVMLGCDNVDVNGEDVFPAFSKIVIDVNKLKEHSENTENPHNVTREQLGLDYVEGAFSEIMTNTATGEGSVNITDSNEYLKINSIGVSGNAIQEEQPSWDYPAEITCVENPEITVNGAVVKLNVKLYGIKTDKGDFIARDRVYTENGKVYLSRGVCILDRESDYSFSLFSQSEKTNLFKNEFTVSSKSGTWGFCNRIPYRYVFTDTSPEGVMASSNLIYLRLSKEEFPDSEAVNKKIREIYSSGGKFEVYYPLKAPVVTEIEDKELLSLLEVKGNVSATAVANIQPGIEICYNQKLNSVIEEIKNAIIALGGEIA